MNILDQLAAHARERVEADRRRVPEEALREASGRAPLWIAGGVTPENAAEIREKFRPELIDVSSGVEKEPGVKDREKIRALFEALEA